MTPKLMDGEDDELLDREIPSFSRLKEPICLKDIMTKCPEFAITADPESEATEETDITAAFEFESLEPYVLTENLEADSEDEDDNPGLAFPTFRKKMECLQDDAKLMKRLERCGSGEVVGDRDKCVVYIHYAAYSELNEYPYDVSRLRQKKPVSLRLGYDSMIPGLDLAIRSMKKGEKSKFLIHPDLAYGSFGVPPRIPPNTSILYDIELIDYTENEVIIARHGKDDDEIAKTRTFEETLQIAKRLRKRGNDMKNHEKNLSGAIGAYRRAVFLLTNFHYNNDNDEKLGRKELLGLYTSLAICFNQKNSPRLACSAYNDACHGCPGMAEKHAKLLYQSAKALKSLGSYDEALRRMKKALQLNPDNEDILRELDIIKKQKIQHGKTERQIYRNMLGFSKNPSEKEEQIITEALTKVNEDFKNLVINQINDLKTSDQESFKWSFGATTVEKEYCKKMCEKNHLSFREIKNDGVTNFIITKKS